MIKISCMKKKRKVPFFPLPSLRMERKLSSICSGIIAFLGRDKRAGVKFLLSVKIFY
jgi:hypothetical protein